MGALLSIIAAAVGRFLGDSLVKWVAFKLLIIAVFTILLPIVLKNFIGDLIDIFLGLVGDMLSGYDLGDISGGMDLTGLLAWLVDCFKIDQCVSIMAGALVLHCILKMVPFSPVD